MQYIINAKLLSIPPYISTSWDNVSSLHVDTNQLPQTLVITLKSGSTIKIPGLDSDILTKIFQTHSHYLEDKSKKEIPEQFTQGGPAMNFENTVGLGFPMRFGGNLEGLGAAMQHDPAQSNAPDMPKEVLEKIAQVSKIMDTSGNMMEALKPEPHCNCMHCQISRAIQGDVPAEPHQEEEEVSEDDLKFKTWDIEQTGDKLYSVKNPLDDKEQYNVFLGNPLGCTCGHRNCEHIKAVLNT